MENGHSFGGGAVQEDVAQLALGGGELGLGAAEQRAVVGLHGRRIQAGKLAKQLLRVANSLDDALDFVCGQKLAGEVAAHKSGEVAAATRQSLRPRVRARRLPRGRAGCRRAAGGYGAAR